MTPEELNTQVIQAIVDTAPDLEPDEVALDAHLQEDLDLDSMDSFNLAATLHQRLGVDIPETAFARLQTPGALVEYLRERLG